MLLPSGKVLIGGGMDLDAYGHLASADAELYDPAIGTFAPTGIMTVARGCHMATLLPNGKVFITSGWSDCPALTPVAGVDYTAFCRAGRVALTVGASYHSEGARFSHIASARTGACRIAQRSDISSHQQLRPLLKPARKSGNSAPWRSGP